jgi:hypothetical protein
MTPQLTQAIKLLTLSNLELEAVNRRGNGEEPAARDGLGEESDSGRRFERRAAERRWPTS